jgi:aspartyl protease family protein
VRSAVQDWRKSGEREGYAADYDADYDADCGAGSGLVWRTARNLGILLAGCLLLLGILNWRGGLAERLGAGASEEPRQSAETPELQSSQQTARSTAMGDEMVIPAGRGGHFLVTAEIDGIEILFLVDTGASQVILTAKDAERLGYRPDDLEFSQRFETANGTILGAPLLLPYFQIGDLELEDVRSSVILAPMSTSLLGMSFLSRLESFEVREEGLILRW